MKGACLCGSVAFQITSERKISLYQCHCSLCQNQSGSTSNTATIVKEEDFQWLQQNGDGITHWQKESGFTSHFCKTCGSPVPNQLRGMPYYWIPMGLVDIGDQEEELKTAPKVVAHLNCNSKASWDTIIQQSEVRLVYDEMPKSIESFIKEILPEGTN